LLRQRYGDLRALPPFPTRRSSDLSYYEALGATDADLGLDFHELAGRWLEMEISGAADGTPRVALPDDLGAVPLSHTLAREADLRSEEHTSELQSRENLVCRLLLEK